MVCSLPSTIRIILIGAAVMLSGLQVHAGDAVTAGLVSQVDPGYRLGAEDMVLVSVWKDEQLTREVVVRPDGMFSFPLVGDIQAEDRTVEEIRSEALKVARNA